MDVADPRLGLGRLFHVRIEQDEVFVLDLGLGQAMRIAFLEPAVGDQKFCLRQIFARVVGIDQRLKRDAGGQIIAVLDIVDGFIEEHLVGLHRVFGDRRFVLLFVKEAENPVRR